jgi:hypothetical protein
LLHESPNASGRHFKRPVIPEMLSNVFRVRFELRERGHAPKRIVTFEVIEQLTDRHPLLLWALEPSRADPMGGKFILPPLESASCVGFRVAGRFPHLYTSSFFLDVVRNPPFRTPLKDAAHTALEQSRLNLAWWYDWR